MTETAKRTVIKNGLVYEGLGHAPLYRDLLISGDRITDIAARGAINVLKTDLVIDASGKVVCPGFVDIHRHHDAKPFLDPDFGRTELSQGITTAVSGNCGISMVPCPADPEEAQEFYAFEEPVMGPISPGGPKSYEDYLNRLYETPLPINTAQLVGTGSVKICVKGFSDTPYTEEELEKAEAFIEDAMKRGAPGVSLGIMYIPECYSSRAEFERILRPVGRYHRLITTHIRGEGDSMVESVKEVIAIAREVGCALEISHIKSCGVSNWRKEIYRAIAEIEKARAEGMDVTCDFYPYDGGSTALTTMLPPAFIRGNMKEALARLGTPEGVTEFRKLSRRLYEDWDNFCITLGWERILVSGVVLPENKKFLGLRMTEAAEKFGFEDAEALAAWLMYSESGKTAIINMSMDQRDIDTVAGLPWSNIISDAIYAKTDTPHPRMFGTFPKVIRDYVKTRKVLCMEEAIRKMTGAPAARMGLKDRGVIRIGAYADILVFDPEKFIDKATYESPALRPEGLSLCMVNGRIVIENDIWNGVRAGQVLTVS